MAIDPMSAVAAYQASAGGERVFQTGNQPVAAPSTGSTFMDMVREAATDAVASNRRAEKLSAEGLAGKADVTQVVTALSEAEATLNTVVTVRDRVISAYQEIMRMPI